MSKLEAIETEVRKLPPEQAMQLQDWLANYLENEAELNPEFVARIERGPADLREGRGRVRKTLRAVNQATEIYSREFDAIFFRLPPQIQGRIEARIRQMGRRLDDFPHARLQGRAEFRLRVGEDRKS